METLFQNAFICYSRTDEMQATNIYHRLKAEGFDVFLDQEEILPGTVWEPKTLSALLNANFIVIVLTEESKDRNGYAMKEIKQAIEMYHHDRYARRMIFPVRVGDAGLPEGLGTFQWTSYSVDGLDRMLKAFRHQQKVWGEVTSPENTQTAPIFSIGESWPWVSLALFVLAVFILRMMAG